MNYPLPFHSGTLQFVLAGAMLLFSLSCKKENGAEKPPATDDLISSLQSFNDALSSAVAGDTLIWKNGTYRDMDMVIDVDHVVIQAQTPGQVIFTGASKLRVNGDHNVFSGFQFLDGDIGTDDVIRVYGSHNHFTQLNIKDYFCWKYVVIQAVSQYTEVSYCNLESRKFIGDKNILSVLVDENKPGYHKIRYCSFKNFEGTGGDMGVEPIRIGLSTQGEFISRTTVEYCYFTNCDGDGEIISHKARQNVYRYNTFEHNTKAEFVLRHGDEGAVYGNFFLNNMGGIRIKEGQRHVVFNNYFSGNTSRDIILLNHSADPVDSVFIAFNTFVESANNNLGASGNNPPKNVLFANNIFASPKSALFSNITGEEVFLNNISFGKLGIPRPNGIKDTNPLLGNNGKGYYELSPESPAINAAMDPTGYGFSQIADWPEMMIDYNIREDIMQQDRPADISQKDLGCSEYPGEISLKPHAREDNTGPVYLKR